MMSSLAAAICSFAWEPHLRGPSAPPWGSRLELQRAASQVGFRQYFLSPDARLQPFICEVTSAGALSAPLRCRAVCLLLLCSPLCIPSLCWFIDGIDSKGQEQKLGYHRSFSSNAAMREYELPSHCPPLPPPHSAKATGMINDTSAAEWTRALWVSEERTANWATPPPQLHNFPLWLSHQGSLMWKTKPDSNLNFGKHRRHHLPIYSSLRIKSESLAE